jgi:hypothetical protein
MFFDEILRLRFAAAATSADRQAALHFKQGARAVIHSFADFSVGYGVANANVHVSTGLDQSVQVPHPICE